MTSRILLIGMMGSGKTTVGRALSRKLGWPYLDSDDEVRRNTGRTVPEIFAEHGEAAFRAEEKRALREAATSDGPVVIGVAGGAVLDAENRRVIRQAGTVVWLRASVETLARRVGSGKGRPLLGDDPAAALERLYPQRRPLYEDLADVVVDVEESSVEEIVGKVLAALPGDR